MLYEARQMNLKGSVPHFGNIGALLLVMLCFKSARKRSSLFDNRATTSWCSKKLASYVPSARLLKMHFAVASTSLLGGMAIGSQVLNPDKLFNFDRSGNACGYA